KAHPLARFYPPSLHAALPILAGRTGHDTERHQRWTHRHAVERRTGKAKRLTIELRGDHRDTGGKVTERFAKARRLDDELLCGHQPDNSWRIISAPALRAFILPRATSRGSGAMPQLVAG